MAQMWLQDDLHRMANHRIVRGCQLSLASLPIRARTALFRAAGPCPQQLLVASEGIRAAAQMTYFACCKHILQQAVASCGISHELGPAGLTRCANQKLAVRSITLFQRVVIDARLRTQHMFCMAGKGPIEAAQRPPSAHPAQGRSVQQFIQSGFV